MEIFKKKLVHLSLTSNKGGYIPLLLLAVIFVLEVCFKRICRMNDEDTC